MNERLDSVWDLLVAQIRALEAKVEALEAKVEALEGMVAAYEEMREEAADWIGGTDD